jgi:hypothetical protein
LLFSPPTRPLRIPLLVVAPFCQGAAAVKGTLTLEILPLNSISGGGGIKSPRGSHPAGVGLPGGRHWGSGAGGPQHGISFEFEYLSKFKFIVSVGKSLSQPACQRE